MSELAAEQLDQLSADRQTNAQSAVFAGHRTVELEEALIHRRLAQIGETDAGVDHRKRQRQTIVRRSVCRNP